MKKKFAFIGFLLTASFLIAPTNVFAGTAALSWFANTDSDLSGYKVYYGLVSRTGTLPCANAGYTSNVDVGNVTTYNFNNLTNGVTYYFAVSAYDTSGNESTCSTQQFKVIPASDTTAPTVTGITVPLTSSSLTVAITDFTATDNTAVTGYMVNESATAPTTGATGWSSTAPTSYTFETQGSKTLYAWAKDAAGNVSTSMSRSVSCALTVSSGGGGGGGGGTPVVVTPPITTTTTTTQPYVTVGDGTVISSEIVAVKNNGVVVKTQVVAEINTTASITKDQSIFLDSFLASQINKMTIALPAEVIQNVVNEYGHEKNIKAMIVSHDASDIQKTNTARQGMFLIGFDVFSVSLTVGDVLINKFDKPLTLNFDVSNFSKPDNFKAYFFNEASGIWEIIPGSAINGGVITATVDHLADFAIMKEIASTPFTEILSNRNIHWQQIMHEASVMYGGGSDISKILEHNGKSRDASMQKEYMAKYTEPLIKDAANLTQAQTYAINNFIVYGSKTAVSLGAGERAGTVGSYKKAFGKLPKTEKEWIDCIAIGNGRYPGATSTAAESSAKKEFEKIYKRKPSDSDAHDKAAITIAAYGLRPNARNTNSEKVAIKSFKAIYKKNPSTAFDWDMVRVIAYSGAKR